MLKFKFKNLPFFASILFLTFLISSCLKKENVILSDPKKEELKKTEGKLADIDTSRINPSAKQYFDQLRTSIVATRSHKNATRMLRDPNNTFVPKLEDMEIETATGETTSFYANFSRKPRCFSEGMNGNTL